MQCERSFQQCVAEQSAQQAGLASKVCRSGKGAASLTRLDGHGVAKIGAVQLPGEA